MDYTYPPFEECRLTTMTLVFILEGSVYLEPAFSLLPITRIQFSPPKRQKKKFELPHCDTPGAILSMRYSGDTRGIIRSTSKSFFKNSITIDLSTSSKNVSIKLSQSKIQMCGASSEEQGREGAQHLIDHLLLIQDNLDYIQKHTDQAAETFKWICKESKGNDLNRPMYKTITKIVYDEEKKEEVEIKEQVFSHNEKDNEIIILEDLSSAPNKKIAEFLLRQQTDFTYYSYFVSELDWILSLERVTTQPLNIKKVLKAMVNFNYNLGFNVNRFALYENMLGRNGFVSSYDNCVEHCVKIKLPYKADDEEGNVRRKNKIPCHCFLIYKSGVVTQTGPGEEKMKEAYELFWKSINEIRDKIVLEYHVQPKKKVIIKRKVKPEQPAIGA